MITRDQIRAARALLDWGQPRLAELAEVSTDLISKIENGVTDGSVKTLNRLQVILENHGIEFSKNDGVSRKTHQVYTIAGRDNFLSFFDKMYQEVLAVKELYACNVDERLFDKWLGETSDEHTTRMENIEGLVCLTLVEEGQDYFPCESYTQYRWVKKAHFDPSPFYVFGDTVAILLFEEDVTVIVINHPDVARSYKKQFLMAWDGALIPPK